MSTDIQQPLGTPESDSSAPRGEKRKNQLQLSCSNCRARKVKCDRRQPSCLRCTKLGIVCSYLRETGPRRDLQAQSTGSETLTQAGFERRRIRRACQACRTYKAKCSGGEPCSRCEVHQLDCVYAREPQNHQLPPERVDAEQATIDSPASEITGTLAFTTPNEAVSIGASSNTPARSTHVFQMGSNRGQPESLSGDMTDESLEPNLSFSEASLHSRSLIRKCIDAYFDLSDPTYCAFLHKALLLSKWHRNILDHNVLQVVCASGLRLMTGNSEPGSTSFLWANAVHVELLAPRALEKPSTSAVQALVLLIQFYFASKAAQDAWILLSVASRLAFTMRLNYEQPAPTDTSTSFDIIGRECLRRMMWVIFVFDKLFSGGIEDLTQGDIPQSQFLHGNLQQRGGSGLQFDMDAIAYRIRLFELRERIFRCTRSITAEGSSPAQSSSELQAFDDELQSFRNALPTGLQLNPERLIIMAHSKECAPYVALHCMWHLCRCDLHRLLIPGIREAVTPEAFAQTPPSYVNHCQSICFETAANIMDLLSDVHDLGTSANMNSPSFAVTLYQCGQVLHHLAFRAPETGPHSIHELRNKLGKAFALISHLGKIYQWLSPCIADIQAMVSSLGLHQRGNQATDQSSFSRSPHARSKHVFAPSISPNQAQTSDKDGISRPSVQSLSTNNQPTIPGMHRDSPREDQISFNSSQALPAASSHAIGPQPVTDTSQYSPFIGYNIPETMFPFDPMQVELDYYADAESTAWPDTFQ